MQRIQKEVSKWWGYLMILDVRLMFVATLGIVWNYLFNAAYKVAVYIVLEEKIASKIHWILLSGCDRSFSFHNLNPL